MDRLFKMVAKGKRFRSSGGVLDLPLGCGVRHPEAQQIARLRACKS
jgi:hypothetical protein